MGLRGFYALLKRLGYVADAVQLGSLEQKRLAVDADMWVYRCLFGCDAQPTTQSVARRISKWVNSMPCTVDLIFSGRSVPAEKSQCLKSRKDAMQKRKDAFEKDQQRRAELQENLERLKSAEDGDSQTVATAATAATAREACQQEMLLLDLKLTKTRTQLHCFTREERAEIATILQEQEGISCIVAPCEADFELVDRSRRGLCDYVVSDDADLITSGCERVLRDVQSLLKGQSARVFVRSDILRVLELSSEQMLQWASLLHCDYQPPIGRVGPATALKMIRKHGTVSGFLQSDDFKSAVHSLPGDLSVDEYIRSTARTVQIFKGNWQTVVAPVGSSRGTRKRTRDDVVAEAPKRTRIV